MLRRMPLQGEESAEVGAIRVGLEGPGQSPGLSPKGIGEPQQVLSGERSGQCFGMNPLAAFHGSQIGEGAPGPGQGRNAEKVLEARLVGVR